MSHRPAINNIYLLKINQLISVKYNDVAYNDIKQKLFFDYCRVSAAAFLKVLRCLKP